MKPRLLFAVVAVLSLSCSVHAVIIAGDDGQGNTNAPSDERGWDYVGSLLGTNGARTTGVYLGSNWVLTAYHVRNDQPTNFTLNGVAYGVITTSWQQMTNSNGTKADLALVQISTNINLPSLTLRDTTPAAGTAVSMIGYGKGNPTNLTTWYVNTNTWVWSTAPTGTWHVTKDGYSWTDPTAKRWGTNTVSGSGLEGNNYYLATTFDNYPDEAQGARYDSGGGVFAPEGNAWELAGIMYNVTAFNNQPGSTAVFGNQTYAVDVSQYRDQILTAIPEPTGVIVVGLGTLLAIRMIRRWFT